MHNQVTRVFGLLYSKPERRRWRARRRVAKVLAEFERQQLPGLMRLVMESRGMSGRRRSMSVDEEEAVASKAEAALEDATAGWCYE